MTRVTQRKLAIVGLLALLLSGFLFTPYAAAAGLKKVVAVSRFENRSSWGGGGQWDIGSGMADQLTDALIQSKQFVVMERQTVRDVLGEQDLATSGRARKSKSAQTGKLVSAQILIKGTITEFESASTGSDTGVSIMGFNVGASKGVAHVGLILRLIDTTTGEVLDSQRVEGEAKSGRFKFSGSVSGIGFGNKAFKKTPIGKATQIAIDNAVEVIATKLRALPFQGHVIKVTGNDIYVSTGIKTGASVGDVFTVYSRGEEVVDPVTGELLGVEETTLGKLKLYQVKEKYSKAKPIGRLAGLKQGDIIRDR